MTSGENEQFLGKSPDGSLVPVIQPFPRSDVPIRLYRPGTRERSLTESQRKELLDFSNPGHLKLSVLSNGINIGDGSIFQTAEFAANQFPYGYSSQAARRIRTIPGEFVLPNDVYVGLNFRENSPWSLDMVEGKPYLTHAGEAVVPVDFVPRPEYYGKKLSNGQMTEQVAPLYGSKYILSYFLRGGCYYFAVDKACKFCSLNPTRKDLGADNLAYVKPKIAQEAAELAFASDQDIKYVNYCSGNDKNNDRGVQHFIDVVRAVKATSPDNVRHHVITMPPDTLSLLQDLKDAGAGTVNFAIEVFDPGLFAEVCSGKDSLYGRDKFFDAIREGVRVFGEGKTFYNFVGGMEPVENVIKGFETFARMGAAPSVNVFHPDPESAYADRSSPSEEYLMEMAKAQASIYKRYPNFTTIYPVGGSRNSLDTEILRGFFN